jgi:alkylation response protein AidB-like acyl-CoA dehydrogenase
VDFVVSDDQQALAAGIRSLVQGRMPLEALRAREGQPSAVDPDAWAALAGAGVFTLLVPESDGGVGLGLADAAVVFEELGRALVPGPLVATTLAAGILPGAADGTARYSLLEGGGSGPGAPAGALPRYLEHPHPLAGVLVLPDPATPPDSGAVALLEPSALDLVEVDGPLDPLTPLARLDVPLPAGRPLGDGALAGTLRVRGTVLTAALGVGSAAACVDLAVAYAKERRQFGRPIGGFQAVKHLCADMLVRAEVARASLHAAAVLADEPDVAQAEASAGAGARRAEDVLWRAVAGAKVLADEAAWANARACIQVHGGMGFTWEVPIHLYLKRALVRAHAFGTAEDRSAAVAELL